MGPLGLNGGTQLLLVWVFLVAVSARQRARDAPALRESATQQHGTQLNWLDVFKHPSLTRTEHDAPPNPKQPFPASSKRTISENHEMPSRKSGSELWRETVLSIAADDAGRTHDQLDEKQQVLKRRKRSPVPDGYVVTLVTEVHPSGNDLDDLADFLSQHLRLPNENIHATVTTSESRTPSYVELYFTRLKSDGSSTESEDLIPANLITSHLSLRQLQTNLPAMRISSVYSGSGDPDQMNQTGLSAADIFREPYFPYLLASICVLVVVLIAVTVWCCLHQKNRKNAALSSGYGSGLSTSPRVPQQICLQYPAAKPNVGTATMIQPDVSQIITNKACGGCGTPVRGLPFSTSGMASPGMSGSSSNAGTPLPGTPTLSGTPVHTPPLRLKKGLLERRGSNASLTIDLGSSMSDSPTMGSPPRESTAEEYLLSAGNRMSRKQLRNCLKVVKNLYEEFWEIPMNHPDKIEVAGSGMKNRYRTIIPNESTRVKLPETDGDPLSGYINANYIRGYTNEPKTYIATQGPMSNTVGDFWRMMWQEKAPIIVMITKLKEKNRTKCEGYLPDEYGTYGNLEVYVNNVCEKDGYQLREITIKYLNEEHKVLHYWYTAWPDHKAPNTARTLLELVKEVEAQRTSPTLNPHRGPVIIHCSAGIGRTGCFIATSTGIRQLQEEHMVDVLGTVCGMRLDRGGMVQTNEQYEFVHHTLCLFEKELPEHPPSNG